VPAYQGSPSRLVAGNVRLPKRRVTESAREGDLSKGPRKGQLSSLREYKLCSFVGGLSSAQVARE
jgi:hypothetical protein